MPSIFDELPGFLELGAWTTRHIRPLFDLFRDEDVAPALALIIFGSALVLCFLFIIDSSFIGAGPVGLIRAQKFRLFLKQKAHFGGRKLQEDLSVPG